MKKDPYIDNIIIINHILVSDYIIGKKQCGKMWECFEGFLQKSQKDASRPLAFGADGGT